MAIITISRGSYSRGEELAEKVAERLGYECIDRETLIEASVQSHIPEIKLFRAIHDAPSILDRITYGKEKYIAHIQAALVSHVQKDSIVYHGLAGHFLLAGISHVLKVHITADREDRVKHVMLRENIRRREALRIIKKDDDQRRKWSKYLYGIDTNDPSPYDLALHISKISVNNAIDLICHTVGLKAFQATPQSKKAMDDLVLSCEVKARLIDLKPDIEVWADDGVIFVETVTTASNIETITTVSRESELTYDIKRIAEGVPGVKEVHVKVRYSALPR